MNTVGKITRVGFVWLTAVMTLVTSLPHFRCQCPNGSIKPICFGVFCSSSSGCCCGEVCSGPKNSHSTKAVSGRKGRPACCCARPISKPTPKPSDGPPRVEGRGCQKTLAPQQQLAPSAPIQVVHDRGAADSVPLAVAVPALSASVRTGTETIGLHRAVPPPSDLVIVLQRFLI